MLSGTSGLSGLGICCLVLTRVITSDVFSDGNLQSVENLVFILIGTSAGSKAERTQAGELATPTPRRREMKRGSTQKPVHGCLW